MNLRILKKPKSRTGVLCFCLVHNEEWFLPHFLAHYRALGVGYFVFCDDGSTDRTREILMAQDDCMLLVVEPPPGGEPASALAQQTLLINRVPELIGRGAWSITVDADEFLVLPEPFSTLGDVIAYLEDRNLNCALAAMTDFFPERLSERFYDDLDPFEGSPWFDAEATFVRTADRRMPKRAVAGVRVRLLAHLARRFPARYRELYDGSRYRFARSWKVPLLKTGTGIRRLDPHNISVRPPDDIQLALAHFKFYPQLDRRIDAALERETHFRGALEYRFLRTVLDLFHDEPLIAAASKKYRSPEDLEQAGLIWAR